MIEDVEIKISDNVRSPICEKSKKMAQEIFDLYFNFIRVYDLPKIIVDDIEKQLDYGELFDDGVKLSDKSKEVLKRILATNITQNLKEQRQKYKEKIFAEAAKQGEEKEDKDSEIYKVKEIIKENLEQLFTAIGDKFDRGAFINGTVNVIDNDKRKLHITYYDPNAKNNKRARSWDCCCNDKRCQGLQRWLQGCKNKNRRAVQSGRRAVKRTPIIQLSGGWR